MANQIIVALPRVTDANGDPVSGAKAKFYQAGTTTPLVVYAEDALSTALGSTVTADSSGAFAQMFYNGATDIKVVVTDADDATLYQFDPLPTFSGTSSDAESVSFSPVTNNASANVQAAIETNTTAIQARVPTTRTISAGTGLTGGGALDANRSLALDTTSVYISKVLLATKTASASATLDFTEFVNATYHTYEFYIENLIPGTDGDALWIRTSTDGGSTYDSSAGNYQWSIFRDFVGGNNQDGSNSATRMELTGGVGNAANEIGVNGLIILHGAPLAAYTSLTGRLQFVNTSGTIVGTSFSGLRSAASDVTGVRFMPSTGNFASGKIRMYGLK